MPGVLGAVYRPAVEMLPPVEVHVTAELVEPVTVAVNCCVVPVCMEAVDGLTLTAIVEPCVTEMDAEAVFVGSATLDAVTVYVPAEDGAVYVPELVMLPLVADHVTAVLLVPVTKDVNC